MNGLARAWKAAVGAATFAVLAVPSLIAQESAGAGTAEGGAGTGAPGSADLLRTVTGLDGANLEAPLRALALVTIFGVVPSIVLLTTSFPRILVVLSFLRRALGAQDLPPNVVVFGLSILLTGVVMTPVWRQVYVDAYRPLVETHEIDGAEAWSRAQLPLKRFLLAHTLRDDLLLMVDVAREREQESTSPGHGGAESATLPDSAAVDELSDRPLEELGLLTILPAFVISELELAFQMGFLLLLPFLLIDLLVSAVLVSMGMIMLPPALVSLPLKVLVFVLVDGWGLVVRQILFGFDT